jgi:tetratricopeptide (TPR) repeat protein
MKRLSAIVFLISVSTNVAFGQASSPAHQKERERWPDGSFKWTTTDSVSMTEYGLAPSVMEDPEIYPSPDGKYFFVLAYRGDVAGCGCTYRTMSVYETSVVQTWLAGNDSSPIAPLRILQRSTKAADDTAIGQDTTWDSRSSIMFTGQDEKDTLQIFRYDVATGKLSKLTDERGIQGLSYTAFRDGVGIFRRQFPEGRPAGPTPAMEPVPRNQNGDLVVSYATMMTLEWGTTSRDGKSWTLPVGALPYSTPWIAPGGKYAVMPVGSGEPGKHMVLSRFVLVDFDRRMAIPMGSIAVPVSPLERDASRVVQALWTSDGSEAVLVNVSLPATAISQSGDPKNGYIAGYSPATGRWSPIEELKQPKDGEEKTRSIGWLVDGKELLVAREKNGKPTGGTVYSRQGDKWVGRSVDASVQQPEKKVANKLSGLNIFVKQSMNAPQVLTASDGIREKAMSQPDPALKGVGIAQMKPFTFAMPDGSKLTAGLTLPLDFKPGSRLPLVIQNSAYKPDLFLPDGQVPTGLARQALVAKGFAVLDLGSLGTPLRTGPMTEGPAFVERVDTVVEALAKEGIVDPARVGLVGHSRAGWQVHYLATHAGNVKIAAAEIWDSTSMDYIDYLEAIGTSSEASYLRTNGGPFWQNKENWLKHDVRFNADRAEAPMLFVGSIYAGQVLETSARGLAKQTIAALQANRRPIEYVFYRGAHTIRGASQRKAAMDLNVDWMNFWIQGKEDSDPSKAEQYKRWRMIREKNEQRKAEEAKLGKVTNKATTAQSTVAPTATPHPQTQQTPAAQIPDDVAIQRVKDELKAAGIPEPQNMFPLNSMGYREMYVEKDMVKAEKLFRWNLILFPKRERTADGLDSMGEYYVQAGNVEKAIECYTKALEMKPTLQSKAKQIIQRLKTDPSSLGAIQEELRQDYINFTKSNPGE